MSHRILKNCLFPYVAAMSLFHSPNPALAGTTTISNRASITITTDAGPPKNDLCFDPTAYPVGTEPSSVTMADLNGDGFRDLAVADHAQSLDNRVAILINNGDGTFMPSVYYDAGSRPYWIALGDVDGDLDNDMAVTNFFDTTISLFLNNGDGTFAAQITHEIGNGPGFIVMADLDGDNDLDLAATNISDSTVSILMNNGDGTFAAQVTYPCGIGPYGLVAANLDGVNGLDLAISNHHADTVNVLMNNGDGTFAKMVSYTVNDGPCGNDAGDLNNDGWHDLVVVNLEQAATGNTLSVLMNNGDGTFAAHIPHTVPVGPYTVKMIDFNSDGWLDVVCSNESGYVTVLLNNGDGTLATPGAFQIGPQAVGLDVGDLDGNGTPEVAVTAYSSDEIWVLFNQYAGFAQQPGNQSINAGETAVFNVVASNFDTLQWRHDGAEISDGPTGHGSTITGSNTDTLTITNAQPQDAGQYDVVAASDCGNAISDEGTLDVVIPKTCPADVSPEPNGDGVVNVNDLLAVINGWGPCAGDPDPCHADITDDGTVNVNDLLAVINSWGPCD